MARQEEATLLLKIKQVGQDVLDRFVITLGDVINIARDVFNALAATVEAYREQEQAVNSLNQAMINAGTFTAELQNEYLNMADALRKVTTFGDEEIVNAQALLQSHIGNRKVTEELVRATLDLATAKKMDLASAADLIGKSIATENNVLSRHGIVLDEATAKNDRMGAVIDAVSKKHLGQAEAAAKGLGAIDRLSKSFGELLEVVGERLAPILGPLANSLANLFDKAAAWVSSNSLAKQSLNDLKVEAQQLKAKLWELNNVPANLHDKQFSPAIWKAKVEITQKALNEINELIKKQAADEQASTVNAAELNQKTRLEKELETAEKLMQSRMSQHEFNMQTTGATYEQELAAQNKFLDEQIKNETDAKEKIRLMEEKYKNLQALEHIKGIGEENKRREEKEQKEIRDRDATLSTIAGLQRSNNATLAAIGKAAALTEIAIQTPIAVGRALAAFPPPFNYAAAAAVGAAMAAQAAQVVGVPLAEGGIVRATQGGIPAIIGEGGRDEAVIPLENGRVPGMGTTINLTINGGVMGSEYEAREFARAIDKELLKLRQNNESVSFDGIS